MTEKYIMCSLEDEKSIKLGEAISNPTCKKIINLLAEKESSASEISKELKIPMNTMDYSLKKLIDAGIIEKSKHFWSVKGKKIPSYRVVNKVIVIQPKKISNSNVYSKLKGFSLMLVISGILTGLVAWITRNQNSSDFSDLLFEESSTLKAAPIAESFNPVSNVGFLSQIQPWMWFAFGALIVMIIVMIVNWKNR
jgi:DNA-binding transcriptional ArsR family regulator